MRRREQKETHGHMAARWRDGVRGECEGDDEKELQYVKVRKGHGHLHERLRLSRVALEAHDTLLKVLENRHRRWGVQQRRLGLMLRGERCLSNERSEPRNT